MERDRVIVSVCRERGGEVTYPGGLSVHEEEKTVPGDTGASVVLNQLINGVEFAQPHKIFAVFVLQDLEVLNLLTIPREKW